jgi:hypothetical protein
VLTAYIAVTVVAALANFGAATLDASRAKWVLANMTRLGVPHSQLQLLGAIKVAGATGLLAGLGEPLIGYSAAAGLVLFFAGAIATAIHARWYAHIPYPAGFLLLAAGSLILGLASA